MRRALAAFAALAILAGCGHDWTPARPAERRAVAATVHDYLGMKDTCRALTGRAGRELAEFLRNAIPPDVRISVKTCDDARRTFVATGSVEYAAAGIMDYTRARSSLATRRVERVEVSGDSARAHLGGSHKAVELIRDGGRWRISDVDFSDVPEDG